MLKAIKSVFSRRSGGVIIALAIASGSMAPAAMAADKTPIVPFEKYYADQRGARRQEKVRIFFAQFWPIKISVHPPRSTVAKVFVLNHHQFWGRPRTPCP